MNLIVFFLSCLSDAIYKFIQLTLIIHTPNAKRNYYFLWTEIRTTHTQLRESSDLNVLSIDETFERWMHVLVRMVARRAHFSSYLIHRNTGIWRRGERRFDVNTEQQHTSHRLINCIWKPSFFFLLLISACVNIFYIQI